jgi:hypothetical protein
MSVEVAELLDRWRRDLAIADDLVAWNSPLKVVEGCP